MVDHHIFGGMSYKGAISQTEYIMIIYYGAPTV